MLTTDEVDYDGNELLSSNHHTATANAKLASVSSIATDAAEKAKSAAAETAKAAETLDPIGDLIKQCEAVANGESVFKVANAHIFDALTAAYPIYLLIKDNKTDHQRVIEELMAKGGRERMPSLNKAALNATVLACHPEHPEEFTNCSDWQNVLVLAEREKMSPDNFREWVKDKKIGDAKRKIRAAKKASKQLKTPFTEGDFPALAYVFKHEDNEQMFARMKEALMYLDQQAAEALTAAAISVA